MQKIKVDPEKCLGCGLCASLAPKTFKINDQFKAVVIEPPKDSESKIQEAVEACPVAAISFK